MSIPDEKTKLTSRLTDRGRNLDPMDLDAFYRWVHDSYEALRFHPFQQQRFDKYCLSSLDSSSVRIFSGT
jgi:hypothetical protein